MYFILLYVTFEAVQMKCLGTSRVYKRASASPPQDTQNFATSQTNISQKMARKAANNAK